MAIPTLITPASGHSLTGTEWDDLYSAVRWGLPRAAITTAEQTAATDGWLNHPELSVQVEAHTVWSLEFKCFYSAGGTDDMKCRFGFPAGVVGDPSDLTFGTISRWSGDSGSGTNGPLETYAPLESGPLAVGREVSGTSSSSSYGLLAIYTGTLVIGPTGGTVLVQFAKNTHTTGETAVVRKRSTLVLRRLD